VRLVRLCGCLCEHRTCGINACSGAPVRGRAVEHSARTYGEGGRLLCNLSYFENRVCHWDAATMTAS
jgi:hypothetical protein